MTARALVTTFILTLVPAAASAQIQSNPRVVAPFKAIAAKAGESTVRIINEEHKPLALGTVVFSDGYILTKASEVREPLWVKFPDGTEYEATVVGRHKETDLALLKVDEKNLKAVTFSDSAKLAPGSWLIAASERSDPAALGIVSVKTRKLTGADAEAFNYNRGYMGVILDRADHKDKEGKVIGAKVQEVSTGGAAKKAGLKTNDIIIAVDGVKVAGRVALQESLENRRPKDKVTITYLREDDDKTLVEHELKVELGDNPMKPSRGDIQNSMGSSLSGRRTGFPAVLQTDMVVDPKNCGGPVVDLDGKVLGICIARAGRVESWILPSENILPLLKDLKSGKYAPAAAASIKKREEQ